MKKYFEYIGILSFALFSFYYTNKVTNIMNSKDPVMINIEKYKEETKEDCKEGYITETGIILGKNGKEVNVRESYSNMQGMGYNEEMMVFDEITCKVNLDNSINNFIVNASPAKRMVSVLINVIDMEYLDDIISVLDDKNIRAGLIVKSQLLKNNEEYFKDLYNKGYELVYNGENEKDLDLFLKTIKSFNRNASTYCISIEGEEMDECISNGIQRLKSNYYYSKNILTNTKNSLENGSFYVYKENEKTLEELSATINYITGKHIEIVSITDILK